MKPMIATFTLVCLQWAVNAAADCAIRNPFGGCISQQPAIFVPAPAPSGALQAPTRLSGMACAVGDNEPRHCGARELSADDHKKTASITAAKEKKEGFNACLLGALDFVNSVLARDASAPTSVARDLNELIGAARLAATATIVAGTIRQQTIWTNLLDGLTGSPSSPHGHFEACMAERWDVEGCSIYLKSADQAMRSANTAVLLTALAMKLTGADGRDDVVQCLSFLGLNVK
ncbi:MAG: hypothetical protein IRZ28_11445 [Steroidobacteraceae bacterium]|nr:hypothetical protein [Steroidobacteraceae bacterium]